MPELWNDLLACLDLRPYPPDTDPTVAVFEGSNQKLDYHRLFGGQILGQFLEAARLTCPSKSVKSMHALFAREGRADEPVRYEVTTQHEGRSFATVAVVARQSERVVATAAISLHCGEDGPEHQSTPAVPAVLPEEFRVHLDLLPWETRAAADLNATAAATPDFEFWMRTPEVAGELAQALTAYATDLNLIGTALRPLHGLSQLGNGTAFTSAVTSHSLWFHRPFRTDRWLLLHQHSPLLAHGRCFGRGDVLTEDGSLVASYAQEALLRIHP